MWNIQLFILILLIRNNEISAGKQFDFSHIKDQFFGRKKTKELFRS
jgi:hypothetical protein